MTGWQQWAARAASRQARAVGLEEALLGGRFGAYAWYRLRWMAAGRAVGLALHAVELAFLVRGFAGTGLGVSLVIGNGCALASGFWWGLLELLRNRLRDGASPDVEIGVWLRRALSLSALLTAGAGGAVAVHAGIHGFGPLHLWALVVVGRLAADLVLRTYYSGVYARRRVFRPFVTILAVEVAGVAGVVALWQVLGSWAFPVALAGQLVLSRGLLYAYTARAYATFRVPRPNLRARRPRSARLGDALWAGLAGAAGRLGSLLVLVLLADTRGAADGSVIVLHLVAPLLATASSWSQVFYLDVRRLDDEAQAALRRRLTERMAPLAWLVGALLWLAGVAVAFALFGDAAFTPTLLATAPLFLAQARLAAPQLAGFAQREYVRVVAGALVLAGTAVVLFGGLEALDLAGGASRPLALAAATIAALAALQYRRARDRGEPPVGRKRSVAAWLRALAAATGPLRLCRADLARTRASQRIALADELAARLGDAGAVCIHGRGLYWFEAGSTAHRIGPADLAVLSGGLVEAVVAAPPVADAAAARVRAAELGLDARARPGPSAALVAEFRSRFPDGLVEDLGVGGEQLAGVDPATRRQMWSDALLAARGGRRRRGSPWEVTAYVPAGEIAVLFAAPRSAPPEQRRIWREQLERATWAASLQPLTDRAETPPPQARRRDRCGSP